MGSSVVDNLLVGRFIDIGVWGVSGTSVIVNSAFEGYTAGGNAEIPGVATLDSADNFVYPFEAGERLYDGGLVYGLLRVVRASVGGTVSVERRGLTLTGVGTSFTEDLEAGCLVGIEGCGDHEMVRVAVVVSDTEVTLATRWRGTALSGGTIVRGDWTVSFWVGTGEEMTEVEVVGDINLHVVRWGRPEQVAMDSVLRPWLNLGYSGGGGGSFGGTFRDVYLTGSDFSYDAESGISTATIPHAVSLDAAYRGYTSVQVDGAGDGRRVTDTPSGPATYHREYRLVGTTLEVWGDLTDEEHRVFVRYISG